MRLFVILFFAELFLSIKVGIEIGFLWSVVWIFVTIIIGFMLLRGSSYNLFYSSQNFAFGKFDIKELYNSSMSYIFGAILLIIPGVLTDLIGLFLLMYVLYLHLFVTISQKNSTTNSSKFENYEGDINVIDTEIIDESCSSSNSNGGSSRNF